MSKLHADCIVLGAGILGSMHARAALQRGLSVIMVDRDAMPTQASIRNFGYHTALKASTENFDRLAKRTGEIYRELDRVDGNSCFCYI